MLSAFPPGPSHRGQWGDGGSSLEQLRAPCHSRCHSGETCPRGAPEPGDRKNSPAPRLSGLPVGPGSGLLVLGFLPEDRRPLGPILRGELRTGGLVQG